MKKTKSAFALATALASVVVMAIGSGCTSKISQCSSDSDCPSGTCDLSVNRCAFLMCDGGAGCPIGTFCNTRVANLCLPIPDGGTNDCVPNCPAYQLCLDTHCQRRYSSIAITQPTNGTVISGPINVVAQLNVNPGFPRSDPTTLTMLIGLPDGGTRSGTLSNQGTGIYQGPVIPTQDGPHQLTARYDAANLSSNTVTVTVTGTNCAPTCPTYQLCLGGQCLNRYSGIRITQPSDGAFLDGGSPVLAQLIANPGFPRQDPQTLALQIVLPDGGAASGTLPILSADGIYGDPGALVPMGDGTYRLVARYDAASLNSNAINVTILTIPPSFIFAIPTPAVGPDAGYLNPIDPGLGVPAWRRDQVMLLTIASANPYIVPGSVRLTVTGVGGPHSTDAGVNPTTGCRQPYCADASVDLSGPDMNAFRGTFGLIVTGTDRAGNVGTTDGGVVVTRWKWAFQTLDGLPIRTSPAVGSTGTVYVGTSDLDAGAGIDAGTLYAINPDGTLKWSRAGGWMTASVAVGEVDGGIEAVYAAMNNATLTNLRAINGTNGGDLGVCGPFVGAAIRGSLAVTKIDGGEACFAAINSPDGGVILAMRPFPTTLCIDGGTVNPGAPLVEPAAIAVDNNNNVYFALSSLRIQSLAFNGGWQARPNWPVDTGANSAGLALVGNSTLVVGSATTMDGGPGGIFALDGGQPWNFPIGGSPRTAWNPSVASGATVFFGDEGPRLTSVVIGSSTPIAQTSGAGLSRGAPILGNDGTVYIADYSSNAVFARSSTSLAPIWSVNNFNGNPFEASLALDCSRDGGVPMQSRPGVLYAPDNTRNLFCFVTDSRGIDPVSAWPKYQHDPRNTGNQQTALFQLACP